MAAPVLEMEGTLEEILDRREELEGKRLFVRVLDDADAPGRPAPSPSKRRAAGPSTGKSILSAAPGRAGDDFDACLDLVYRTRSKAEF